jgi:hypothetical protein
MPAGVYKRTNIHREALKQAWQRPEVRERHKLSPECERLRVERIKQTLNLPEVSAKKREITRRTWQDPIVRKLRTDGVIASRTSDVCARISKNSYMKTEEGRRRASVSAKKRYSSREARLEQSKRMKEISNRPEVKKKQLKILSHRFSDPAFIKKMQEKLSNARNYITGEFRSHKNGCDLHFRSSYELYAYIRLEHDDNIIAYGTCMFSIPYIFEGKARRYIPDIMIECIDGSKQIIEVKPANRLKESVTIAKMSVLENYCRENNMCCCFWTEKDVFNKEEV